MISIFQLFKIVFGLLVSGFILYILINYAGTYAGLQEDVQRAIIMKNFHKTVRDVYLTGNPIDFNFGRLKFDLAFDIREPEGIFYDMTKLPIDIPLLFSPGKTLFIGRDSLDMGWWRFHSAQAVPELHIIFNPLDPSKATVDLMKDITEHLPSTEGFEPKITFGFCNRERLEERLCELDKPCERLDFLFNILGPLTKEDLDFSKCTASLGKGYRLVTISEDCSPNFINQGICARSRKAGIGEFYINGSDKIYLHKDPLDLVAAIIGGEARSIWGIAGENAFVHKNRVFAERVSLAAKLLAQRARLLENQKDTPSECKELYRDFQACLDDIAEVLADKGYYEKNEKIRALAEKLGRAWTLYKDKGGLIDKGCEYPV